MYPSRQLFGLCLLTLAVSCALPTDEEPRTFLEGDASVSGVMLRDGPSARLLQPDFGFHPVGDAGPLLRCRWDAYDQSPDLVDPAVRPQAFEYKLVEVEAWGAPEWIEEEIRLGYNLLLDGGPDPLAWIRVGPEFRYLEIELEDGVERAFAVRAIDESGIPEDRLEYGVNYAVFVGSDEIPAPDLLVTRPGLDGFVFDRPGEVWEITVFPEFPLDLEWVVDASSYGAPPGPTNYGLDTLDFDEDESVTPGGTGDTNGWSGWGRWDGLASPFVFGREEAGNSHTLWIRARDAYQDPESERLAQIRIRILDLPFDKFAVIVDDTKAIASDDEEHDAYIDEVVASRLHELGEVDRIAVYRDPERYDPRRVTLEELGRYQVVLWHTDKALNPRSGLELSQYELAAYLRAGGRVFLIGGRQSSLLLNHFEYPKLPGDPGEGDFDRDGFIWRHLHYRDQIVGVPTGGNRWAKEASGMVGALPRVTGYPQISIDLEKWDPETILADEGRYLGGIQRWEGVLETLGGEYPIDGFESVYSPVTFDQTLEQGPWPSGFEEAVLAHRFESPLQPGENGYQGRSVVFNFQPWYFESEGVGGACERAIDWLVEGLGKAGTVHASHESDR